MDVGKAVPFCQSGNLAALDALIEEGLDVTQKDAEDCSLLHWAAINNRVQIVERLLSRGCDANVVGGVLQSTPLHWAARVGSIASSVLLIKAGAACSLRDSQGYTPIHLAVQGQHVALVAYMLEKFDYAANLTDNSGMTPAMWSAFRCYSIFPLRLILRKNVDVNAKEVLQENTALHLAAQERNYVAISELISAGANVAIKNKQQETALDIARNNRNHKIIGKLEEGLRLQEGRIRLCSSSPKCRKYMEFCLPTIVLMVVGIMFHYIHYGLVAFVLLVFVLLCHSFMKVEMHGPNASLIPIGICVAEPLVMSFMWYSKVHWYAPWYLQIPFVFLMFLLFFMLAKISLGDPGVIKPSDTPEDMIRSIESLRQSEYCFFCFLEKTPKSKHCSVCNRCVKEFDHHCPWLHQCITKKNLREFIAFAFCVGATATIFSVAVCQYLLSLIRYNGIDFIINNEVYMFLLLCLAVFHAFALTVLFVQQCMQISSSTSTYDRILRHREAHSHDNSRSSDSGPVFHDDLTCGERIRNICDFCSGNN